MNYTASDFGLTRRQLQTLKEIARGLSNKQIAHELGCSIKTVEKHRSIVYEKTGLRNAVLLAHFALRTGIIDNLYEHPLP